MLRTIQGTLIRSAALFAFAAVISSPLTAQQRVQRGEAPPELREMIDGVVAMLGTSGDSALIAFSKNSLAPDYRESFSDDELLVHLQGLRVIAEAADGTVGARGRPGSVILGLDEAGTVNIVVEWNDEFLITKLVEATD